MTSALFDAVLSGDVRPINDTVKSVADLEVIDADGRTPLHVAATVGEAAIGAYLVELGADVNRQDMENEDTALHLAARHKHRLVASMLLWGGAKCDILNKVKNTPLHEAVLAKARDVAWLIVENGGDFTVKLKNADGLTPLEIAEKMEFEDDMVEVLRSA
jgi:ankyrin repeat protein